MNSGTRRHVPTLALAAVTAIGLAWPSAPAMSQPMVAADRATHEAVVGDEGNPIATAWFRLDPQNNTLSWTIELEETEITGLTAACFGVGEEVVLPPPEPEGRPGDELAAAAAAELNLADALIFTSPVEGQLGDLAPDLYDLFAAEQCYVAVAIGEGEENYGRILRTSGAAASASAPEPAESAGPAEPAELDPAEVAALIDDGAAVYQGRCATCHRNEGGGGQAPALAGNGLLASRSSVLSQIIFGGAYMPAFGDLSDREIAAVATFVRNSFGNSFGPVTEEQVAAAR